MSYRDATIDEQGRIVSARPYRLIAGHCPDCGRVVAVINHGQMWPLVHCGGCDWQGDTDSVANKVRLDGD